MKIKKLELENFKSFEKVTLEFGKVNLLIGANASGKSNFILVFDLLRNIRKLGIRSAVDELNGIRSLKNSNTEIRNFSINIELELDELREKQDTTDSNYTARIRDTALYEIEFLLKGSNGFSIRENIRFSEHFGEFNEKEQELKILGKPIEFGVRNRFGKFETYNSNLGRQSSTLTSGERFDIFVENPFHLQFIEELNAAYTQKSVLEYPGVFIPRNLFDFGIYEIDPKAAKLSVRDSFTDILNKDASNLSAVIKEILKQDEDTREQFIANISGILGFVENIEVDRIESTLYLKVKEQFNKHASDGKLISNGTASIIAMIVALYHQKHNVCIFEEPEIGIHPHLLAALVENFYDVAEYKNKQIFLTSHSPELLRRVYNHSELNDIYLMRREGIFTVIEKPQNKQMVKVFLKNDMGIEELFIQNLLED